MAASAVAQSGRTRRLPGQRLHVGPPRANAWAEWLATDPAQLYEVCRPLLPQMGSPSTPHGFLSLFLDDLFPADLPYKQRRDYALLFLPDEVGQVSAALATALAATVPEGQTDARDVLDRAAAEIVAARRWPSKKRRSEELDDDHL